MEAAILNLAERGETLLVAKAGIWGQRAADLGRRLGLKVEVRNRYISSREYNIPSLGSRSGRWRSCSRLFNRRSSQKSETSSDLRMPWRIFHRNRSTSRGSQQDRP